MIRQCLALDLKDDPALIAEYERLHQQIWPQISAHLREHGVLDMQIWRLGTRLFMVMDTGPGFSAEATLGSSRRKMGADDTDFQPAPFTLTLWERACSRCRRLGLPDTPQ